MATKTTQKAGGIKGLNNSLISATTAAINATVENGEKWQKLTKKLIKKSEPVRRKPLNIAFDTAEAVKVQFNSGKDRMMDLVEFEQAMEFVKNNPVSEKVMEVADDIKSKVNDNPVVKQLNKTSENLKTKGTAKLNDIKEDVLEQAQTILNKGEKMVEDAFSTKKAETTAPKAKATPATKAKVTATKTATRTTATKRTAKAATTTKSTAKAKSTDATTKTAPAKAATTAAKTADKK